jgi:phosphoserine phosphatase RsbU/P
MKGFEGCGSDYLPRHNRRCPRPNRKQQPHGGRAQRCGGCWRNAREEEAVRVLIAEDDPVSSRYLEAALRKWGYQVAIAKDGGEAWRILKNHDPPPLAILDWMMPETDGLELCRKIRGTPQLARTYVILLTARTGLGNAVAGLEAGADDYVTKPFDRKELRARVHVGERVARLQASLAERIGQLEDALTKVKQLQGLLPICAYCKKIRDDRNYWRQVESYLTEHSDLQFSHGICPECYAKLIQSGSSNSPIEGEPKP